MSNQGDKNVEVRKIQFSGKSSYMLALPKKWIEEMRLRAGDQVTVLKQGNSSLLVAPTLGKVAGTKMEAVIEVSSRNNPASLTRRLISVYLLGYNTIHVKGKERVLTSSQREAVKEGMRRHLIGTEVIADSTEGITLQVLLRYPDLSVKNVVKRMFLIATSMHRDSMLALKNNSKDTAKGIVRADDEVDRFSLYAIRQLNIAVQSDLILNEIELDTRRDCLDYRLIVKSVERVADHASKIAENILSLEQDLDESIMSKVSKMSDFALSLFEESGLALFKGDYEAADRVVERAQLAAEMQKDLLSALERSKQSGSEHVLPLIVEDIRRTAEYAADIAEVVINMSTERAVIKEENVSLKVF